MNRLPAHMREILRELRWALWVPVYLICFFLLERLIVHGYWATQLPLDRLIPFQPAFVVFYCLWYPLLVAVGLFLLVKDRPGFPGRQLFSELADLGAAPQWTGSAAGSDRTNRLLLSLGSLSLRH